MFDDDMIFIVDVGWLNKLAACRLVVEMSWYVKKKLYRSFEVDAFVSVFYYFPLICISCTVAVLGCEVEIVKN